MPDGSDPKDPMFGYVERFAAVLVTAGFPPMPARVFVALLVSDSGRLTSAELAGTLRISPAAVSGAVRYLIQVGLVHKERVPGSRRDHYRLPDNVWPDLLRLRDQIMQRWTALIREGIDLLGPDTPAGARMAEHAAFFEFASKELSALQARWEEYRAGHLSVQDTRRPSALPTLPVWAGRSYPTGMPAPDSADQRRGCRDHVAL